MKTKPLPAAPIKPIKKGDKLTIKPEFMDPGDENYTFYSIDDQLEGMSEIRMRATRNATGEPAIGIQSIRFEMIAESTPQESLIGIHVSTIAGTKVLGIQRSGNGLTTSIAYLTPSGMVVAAELAPGDDIYEEAPAGSPSASTILSSHKS